MTEGEGELDRPIVVLGSRIVAPAVCLLDGRDLQRGLRRPSAIGPIKEVTQRPAPQGRSTVAFPLFFGGLDSAVANGAAEALAGNFGQPVAIMMIDEYVHRLTASLHISRSG